MTYERQIATAKRLLEKFGGPCTYTVNTVGAPTDSAKPWRDTNNSATQYTNVRMTFVPAKPSLREQDRTPIASNTVYIAAASLAGVTPKVGDAITRNSDSSTWRVNTVDTLNLNGEMIMHIIGALAS